jgi:ATP-binding cassette subfamily C protein CydD
LQIMPKSPPSPARAALARWSHAARGAERLVLAALLLGNLAAIGFALGLAAVCEAWLAEASLGPGLAVTAASGLLRAGAQWGAEAAAARAGKAIVFAARQEIIARALRDGARFWDGAPKGVRVSQTLDRTAHLAGFAAQWRPGTRAAILGPLVILVAVVPQTWVAAALMAVSLPVLPLFLWLTVSGTTRAAAGQQAALDHLQGVFFEASAMSGTLRAFNAIDRTVVRLEVAANGLTEGTLRILRQAFLSTAVLEFFAAVSVALVAVYIGFKLLGLFPFDTGEAVGLGPGLAALVLAPEFFAPIRRLTGLHHARSHAVAAADDLVAWLDATALPPKMRRPALTAPPEIRAEGLLLAPDPARPSLGPFSFTAPSGQITVFAGPSGVGKTSLLNLLLADCPRLAGSLWVDSHPLTPTETLIDSIAYLGQTVWLPDQPLGQALTLGRGARAAGEILAALRAAGLRGPEWDTPACLARALGRGGSAVSGGERQRLALARALLQAAPLWVLDEPTAHLDPEAEAEFLETLRGLAGPRTLLIASHRPAVIAFADHRVFLSEGGNHA